MLISWLARTLLVGGLLVLPAFLVQPQSMSLAGQAQAQNQPVKRALIIGNKDYRTDPLANTLNDARDMAAKLRGLGFEVTLKENLPDEKAMKRAIREVTSQIRTGDVFLFYYSGHAMDVKGVNYLLPTQAEINKEVDVEYEALNFNLVLDEIEAARGQANLVILDACRNNPFVQRAVRSANKGLAITRSPSGTYIIYATAPGKVASDNPSGRNGLFTQALLESLDTPGLTQDQVFRQTARKVRDASKGGQEPWAGGSLIDDFYFRPLSQATLAPISAMSSSTPQSVLALPMPQLSRRPVSLPVPQVTHVPQPLQNQALFNSLGMEFRRISAGGFMMGSPSSEKGRYDSELQYRVTLTEDYYMQTTEVTQGQWLAVMWNNPSYFKGDPNLPVEQVSWNDVQEFIQRLNQRGEGQFRLPTEAEWEYAARAGTSSAYSFGNDARELHHYGNFADKRVMGLNNTIDSWADHSVDDGYRTTAPVASYRPNAWGLYDMHGNVYEWVQDWSGDYPNGSSTNPRGPGIGAYRVYRGGSWYGDVSDVRSANRYYASPGESRSNLGFRLVRRP